MCRVGQVAGWGRVEVPQLLGARNKRDGVIVVIVNTCIQQSSDYEALSAFRRHVIHPRTSPPISHTTA